MRIIYLANHLNIGGITSYVFSLASGMKERGHGVYVASGGGRMEDDFRREGIVCVRAPLETKSEVSPRLAVSFFRLLPYIKKNRIDVIHCNTRVTQVLGCLLERASGIAHISTCHGFFKRRVSRLLFPCWGRKVIAVSEAVREHLIGDFGINPSDIVVIHNGIDTERFAVRIKKDLDLGEGPVVGIIARLSDVKGHAYLIRAMHEVTARFPSVKLLIVGDGKIKNELLRLTNELGLGKNVSFLPAAVDTREALSAMDVFVLPSLAEGLGLSLMEAMAAGLAVIGSDIGGIRSLIQNGHNGILVESRNVDALSREISALLQDKQRRQRLGDNAARFIRENFSLSRMTEKTEEVYKICFGAG
ncbi:MAG: glycosyltransferase family 4 protein [Candidatus Omnitrophota bacterium]|jgi:glycosyltransferase involved in cell wall biosynthesis